MGLKSNQSVDAPRTTPIAGGVPKAKPDGTIDAGWLPAGTAPVTMVGATASTDGAAGYVPAPVAADYLKFLRADGTWQTAGGGGGSAASLEFVAATTTGNALVGGDKTGNQRGTNALDISLGRTNVANVASAVGGMAIGYDAKVEGSDAIAIGYEATIALNADWSVALGIGAKCTFADGVAIGDYAWALAESSVALGTSAYTYGLGVDGVAIGTNATVSDWAGVAVGRSCVAAGESSVAIGNSADATAVGSISVGEAPNATATNAIAIGSGAGATAVDAIAIGKDSTASAADSVALGGTYISTFGVGSFGVGSLSANAMYSVSLLAGNATRPRTARLPPIVSPVLSDQIDLTVLKRGAVVSALTFDYFNAKTVTTVDSVSKKFVALPRNVRCFADKLMVTPVVASGVTGQPSLSVTGGSRTSVNTAVSAAGVGGSNNLFYTVASTTGFAVGDWVVLEKHLTSDYDSLGATPIQVGKIDIIDTGASQISIKAIGNYTGTFMRLVRLDATDNNVLATIATTGLTAIGTRWESASLSSVTAHEIYILDVQAAATGTSLSVKAHLVGILADVSVS